jgi:hypothetical protein
MISPYVISRLQTAQADRLMWLAGRQRSLADDNLSFAHKVWGHDGTEPDPDMVAAAEADHEDTIAVVKLFEAGKLKEAYKMARHMDTAPREYILDEIYEMIQNA